VSSDLAHLGKGLALKALNKVNKAMATQIPIPGLTDPTTVPAPPPITTPSAPAPDGLNLDNIQGDILSGLPKKTETFYFFQIIQETKFKSDLHRFIPLIKTVQDVLKDRAEIEKHKRDNRSHIKPLLIPLVGVNISFSHLGFEKLKINDDKLTAVDQPFLDGGLKDSQGLNDKGTGTGASFVPDWEEPFKQKLHGVIVIAGESHHSVDKKIHEIESIFRVGTPLASILKITSVTGDARPGSLSAHEHFGYLDGVSNPAILGFDTNIPPGPGPIRPGVILMGHPGDERQEGQRLVPNERDPWMIDGSFLVFRYLFQKVPEFDDFVNRNASTVQGPGMTKQQSADLLGARLVGRWKSGAPVDITPFIDDEDLGGDPQRNNNFAFSAERNIQKLCPFAAHVRKTLPRADLEERINGEGGFPTESRRIMRRGIQFGPEVTKQEKAQKKTLHGRGLLFACYQSSITQGFQFIQHSWANDTKFPPFQKTGLIPGFDPIIGQARPGEVRKLTGVNPNNPSFELELDDNWVVPRGGEYFFTPSIKGLTETIAAHA